MAAAPALPPLAQAALNAHGCPAPSLHACCRPPRAHSEPRGHRSSIVPSSGTGQSKETPWTLLGLSPAARRSATPQARDPPRPPPAATRQPAGRSASSGLRKSNSDHPRDSSPPKASSYSGVCPPPPPPSPRASPGGPGRNKSSKNREAVDREEPSQGRKPRRGEQGQDQDQHPGLLHLAELEALPQVPRLRGEKRQRS